MRTLTRLTLNVLARLAAYLSAGAGPQDPTVVVTLIPAGAAPVLREMTGKGTSAALSQIACDAWDCNRPVLSLDMPRTWDTFRAVVN